MLLLVTIGLVLIGAISLVIGFVSSSLAPIYLSIACSIVAGGVLVVFSRMSRRQAPAAEGGPAPLAEAAPVHAHVHEEEEVVGAATQTSAPVVPDLPFPIEDYDGLKVNEIVPLLPELDLDELDLVREREVAGRNRATIVKKIDELIEELEAQDEAMVSAPAPAAAVAAEEPTAAVSAVDGGLPIEDYDSLSVAQILPLLPELDDDELETVAEYEETHKNRAQIVKRIDEIFETGEVAGAAAEKVGMAVPPSPAKKAAPAKKTAAKKTAASKKAAAPAKKTAAKKTAASKKAAAPAKKTTAAKATKKAAPAKKAAAPAKKTAAKKAPAKKAPAKKAAKKR